METLIEVIRINEENCSNCHQCIAVCPVKFCSNGSGNIVKFNNDFCIACGRCIEACIKSHGGIVEKSARFALDDAPQFERDLADHDIVALIAPSAHGNFPLGKLISALKRLGVKYVYDVSLGAEITVACYHEMIQKGEAKLPLIATPCPAVVKFIELHNPGLIEHLAPVGSPVHNLAIYVKSLHPGAELAFISPCLAKRREFQDSQIVKYSVTFQSIAKIFDEHNISFDDLPEGEFDNEVSAGITASFSTPGGLKKSYLYHYPETLSSSIVRIEGPMVFDQYLGDLQAAIINGNPHLPLIVDVLSCEKGCNSGVGCFNKSLFEIEYAVARRSEQSIEDKGSNGRLADFLNDIFIKHDFEYRKYRDLSTRVPLKLPSDSELRAIYTNMHKVEEKEFRNCAACGYNSCLQMAIAVFNGLNKVENCHLYQEKQLRIEQQTLRNMHNELSNVFDTMSDGVIVLDKDGRVSQFNAAAQQIIGYSDEALIGVHVVDLFSGKAPKTLHLLETGEAFYDREILLDGVRGKVHATCSGKPIYGDEQQVEGATIILRPIAQVQQLVNTFSGAQASFTFNSIIGEDKQLKRSIKLARIAGTNNSTVLLQAESGTGKEVFAQAIHNSSLRCNEPFVAINCAALPRELVGSELFGYVEGAFTGARRGGRPGKFELANRGTLFLDEIGDMPLEQQAILLRAIQEKTIYRVGGDTAINVDARIIAATNQNLVDLVEQGRFRRDLFYRLNVIKITVPPLRERSDDIKLLFRHFLNEMSVKFNKHIVAVDESVIQCLQAYDWPGNVRELQNITERTLLVAENGHITIENLPREIVNAVFQPDKSKIGMHYNPLESSLPLTSRESRQRSVGLQEKDRILWALDIHGGNVSKAALELGFSRNTLYRKMKAYSISN